MPNLKSSKKALRQSIKRRAANLRVEGQTKEVIKKMRNLIANKEKTKAKELLSLIYKKIDKMAKKGIIKKGTSARKKSRITKAINKL
jgi:small subunit ribosomal protein S20